VLSQLSLWILNKLGWTIQPDLPDIKKFVVIAAPHTSNWDFPLGILAAKAMKLDISWLGKHSIFRWPFGWFFRAIGGTAINRDSGQNYIRQMAEVFESSDRLILALAPEGTRSKTDHWKTGFHYIARAANVPIVMAHLDFGNKRIGFGTVLVPSEDIEADFVKIREYYKDKRGKSPGNESLIRIRKKDESSPD
jgi:1-acyl-sn-glycerol-3-phosphate acyltransferase